MKYVAADFKGLLYLLLCVDDQDVVNFQLNHGAKSTVLLHCTFWPSHPREWVLRHVFYFRQPATDKHRMVHMLIAVVELSVLTPSNMSLAFYFGSVFFCYPTSIVLAPKVREITYL